MGTPLDMGTGVWGTLLDVAVGIFGVFKKTYKSSYLRHDFRWEKFFSVIPRLTTLSPIQYTIANDNHYCIEAEPLRHVDH